MITRTLNNLHQKAKAALTEHQQSRQHQTENLVAKLQDVIVAYQTEGDSATRLAAITQALEGQEAETLQQCREYLASTSHQHLPFLLPSYRYYRKVLLDALEALDWISTSQDTRLVEAIGWLLQHRHSHREWLPLESAIEQFLNAEEVAGKWPRWLLKKSTSQKISVHRHALELCVFTQVVQALKSDDICIQGGLEYADYRPNLVSWDEYQQNIQAYTQTAGIPYEAKTIVSKLKQELTTLAKKVDQAFPDNDLVVIENGEPVIRKQKKSPDKTVLKKLDQLISQRLPVVPILDVLVDTEQWLSLSQHFKPLSGYEPKRRDHQKRWITTLFCYGCNLGPTQTARSIRGLNRRQISWINLHQVTEEKIEKAIVKVINAYNRFILPKHWGSGKSVSVDGKQWDVYEDNLLSQWHLRYGSYGGIWLLPCFRSIYCAV